MFLSDIVIGLIEDNEGANVDDLLPHLPDYTRKQVMAALQNLSFAGRVKCVRQGVKGRHRGAKPGRYWLADAAVTPSVTKPQPRPVNSIFQMGDRAGAQA